MTQGDSLFGIETIYKGIKFRSKLETKIAFFLDCLNIKWEYDPKTFLLSNGICYIPDFYLTELKIWIEVKGDIQRHNIEFSKLFIRENNTELLMISNNNTYWFSSKDFVDGIGEDKDVYIGKCSNCNKYFFCSNLGSYHCRSCATHEGDHDLLWTFNSSTYGLDDDKINFYDTKSILEYLKPFGIKLGDKDDSIPKV